MSLTRTPLQLRPVKGTEFPLRCLHNRAAPTALALPALAALVHPCTSTRKERSDMLAQKTHDNGSTQMARLR